MNQQRKCYFSKSSFYACTVHTSIHTVYYTCTVLQINNIISMKRDYRYDCGSYCGEFIITVESKKRFSIAVGFFFHHYHLEQEKKTLAADNLSNV